MKVNPLPTLVTCGNLTAGFLATLLAAQGGFVQAAALVLAAAGLDLLDGAIARASDSDGQFGTNLDSLADLVSFGVAPAVAIYLSTLQQIQIVGVAVCLFYLVCGALRLARFPFLRGLDHFVGLPIPPAGVMLVGLAVLNPAWPLTLAAIVILSALMVSEIPFPKLSGITMPGRSRDEKHPRAEDL